MTHKPSHVAYHSSLVLSEEKLLNDSERRKIKLGLERIEACLKYLGNPHKKFKSVLIAGTNGKGSVTFYLSNLACIFTNYKIGRYTSPHLISWEERYVINEKVVDRNFLKEFSETVIRNIKSFEFKYSNFGKLTEFEIYTVIAFCLFASENVDIAFLEVGMGGRLDATNVVPKENVLCSIITNISFDHTGYLGEKLEKIAYEKSGIIKENNRVITGVQDQELSIIHDCARKLNSKLISLDSLNYGNLFYPDKDIEIALVAWEEIIGHISTKAGNIEKKEFLSKLQFPGRYQYFKKANICQSKSLLLDGAHNPAAAFELRRLIERDFKYKNILYILGFLDKDYKGFIKNLLNENCHVICTEPKSSRATKKENLREAVISVGSVPVLASDLNKAIIKACKFHDEIIVITGSLYLVGEALQLVEDCKLLSNS